MTTMWNDRLLPYPLLASWTDDYGQGASFSATLPGVVLDKDGSINLPVKYQCKSPYLKSLITAGQAKYASIVLCDKTFTRQIFPSGQDDEILTLNAGEYHQSLMITPYIVAAQPIEGFKSAEHAVEFQTIKPEGFDLAPASILAVGDSTLIRLEEGASPDSVIDLVARPEVAQGAFQANFDDNRIRVYVSSADKANLEALRDRGANSPEMAALFPGVYLHVITEALRHLNDHDNQEAAWVETFRRALQEKKVDVDADSLKENALQHAQTLMDRPLKKLIAAFINPD